MTARGEWAGNPATGGAVRFEAWGFTRLGDGQIQEGMGMYDPATIFRQPFGPMVTRHSERRV